MARFLATHQLPSYADRPVAQNNSTPTHTSMSTKGPEITRVRCNACGLETKHLVVATRVQYGSQAIDDEISVSWVDKYELLECMGCETICVRRSHEFSETPDIVEVTFYPPQIARRAPAWLGDLPATIGDLLMEVYAALHNDSRRLAMMGVRAIIDIVMNSRVGDVGGFARKLDAMVASGFVSDRNRKVLEAALDAGHAAAHRGHEVSVQDADLVMDILENLLHMDLIDRAAANLAASIPAREARAASVVAIPDVPPKN